MTPRRPWIALAFVAIALAPLAACAAWQAEPNAPDAAAMAGYELFAAKDLDRNGALTPAELAIGLAPAPTSEARRVFALLDRNHDGRVMIGEYFPDPGAIHTFGFTAHSADQAGR